MRLDTSGRLTKPYQPAFLIGFPGFNTTSTAVIVASGGTLLYNIGSHLNTSTMRFTCPVAGMYLFCASFLKASSAICFRGNFYKNGSAYGAQMRFTEGFNGYNDVATLTEIGRAHV